MHFNNFHLIYIFKLDYLYAILNIICILHISYHFHSIKNIANTYLNMSLVYKTHGNGKKDRENL